MGYTTQFNGTLKFTYELTMGEFRKLNDMLGENPDKHPEWLREPKTEVSYLQWEITPDYDGIQWDGSEKFYHATESVNLILLNMRADFPDFGLEGELLAQGEAIGDVWKLVIRDGRAVKVDIKAEAGTYRCPHCGAMFAADEGRVK